MDAFDVIGGLAGYLQIFVLGIEWVIKRCRKSGFTITNSNLIVKI
jgi:hypothetical protein